MSGTVIVVRREELEKKVYECLDLRRKHSNRYEGPQTILGNGTNRHWSIFPRDQKEIPGR